MLVNELFQVTNAMNGTSGKSWNRKRILWTESAPPGAMIQPSPNVKVV